MDWSLGYLLFSGLFISSFLGFISRIQASLLFNIKFAKSLKRGRLLVSACLTPDSMVLLAQPMFCLCQPRAINVQNRCCRCCHCFNNAVLIV